MRNNKIHIEPKGEHLTQPELIAYSRADLGVQEMYRLELHIIDCELCSEALEGLESLTNTSGFEKSLSSINDAIKPSTNQNPKKWMMVAASIFLIFSISISVWFINQSSSPEPIAENIEVQDAESDIQKTEEKIIESVEGKNDIQNEPPEAENDNELANTNIIDESVAETQDEPTMVDMEFQSEERLEEPELVIDAEENQLIDQSGQELRVAEQRDTGNAAQLRTNEQALNNNNKKVMAQPSVALEEAPANTEPPPSLQKSRKFEDVEGTYIEPTPTGGKSAFRKFIKNNIRYPELARQNKIRGEVELDIAINESGVIEYITVVESLGYGCDEEAIRLIQSGPEWIPARQNGRFISATTEVIIKFRP